MPIATFGMCQANRQHLHQGNRPLLRLSHETALATPPTPAQIRPPPDSGVALITISRVTADTKCAIAARWPLGWFSLPYIW